MNLIQIQDKLRAMPMELLQQYANGSNPEVPPYVALGVLQEKQAMAQRQGMQQGAANGQMPTVKEKVEQASGLMALQQQKQQQAAQQAAMANANKPGPVPGGVQPAAAQRSPADAVPMRAGGLARLRSNLSLAGGGIVAFGGGGSTSLPQVMEEIRRRNPTLSYEEVRKMAINQMARYDSEGNFVPKMRRDEYDPYADQTNPNWQPKERTQTPQNWEEQAQQDVDMAEMGGKSYKGAQGFFENIMGGLRSLGQNQDVEKARAKGTRLSLDSGPMDEVGGEEDMPVIPTQKKPPVAPNLKQQNVPTKAAPATAPAPAPVQKQSIVDAVPQASAPVGPQASIDAMKQMRDAFGYGQSKYDPQVQAKLDEMSKAYEDSKKSRKFEDMLRVLGGSRAGIGGTSAAYLANQYRNRQADAAERQRQLTALQGLREQEQGVAKEMVTGARTLEDRAMTGRSTMEAERLRGENAFRGDQLRAAATIQAARIAAAAREATDDTRQLEKADRAFERNPIVVSKRKKIEDSLTSPEDAARLQREINTIQIETYKRYNINVDTEEDPTPGPKVQMPKGVKVTKISG